jgi:Mn2+/Fe2+ NRAMP family transporter
MISIQMVSARIGWFTGQGLAASMRRVLPAWLTGSIVVLLVFANTLNIGADIAAMGEALQLIVGGPEHGHALVFGVLCTILPLWLGFDALVRTLKWLTLALLSYVAVVLMLHVDWSHVLLTTLVPRLQEGPAFWAMVVAVLGTTISPYLFFWQAAQEAEQRQSFNTLSGVDSAHIPTSLFAREHLSRIKLDTVVGMVFSNGIAFCVMLATALTLNAHGMTDIQSTKDAALALRPLAGDFAFTLFAIGVIGTGMLAVPVLAASSAYAVADAFQWKSGLNHRLVEARGFFTVIALGTLIGTSIDFTPLDPIKALIWSALVNGVIAVPIMAVMMWMGARKDILGEFTLSTRHRIMGWLTTLVMAAAVVAMVVTAD